jgi:hypothetical protein
VSAGLRALGDDDVDAGLLVAQRLLHTTTQRSHQAAALVDRLDDALGRRAERVGDQCDPLVTERLFHERNARGLGPPEQVGLLVVRPFRDAVLAKQLLRELAVLARDHRLEPLLQLPGVHLPDPLVLLGNHGVDPVGLVAHVLVDPFELHGELLGGEPHRAQHAQTAGPAHLDHDVATVGEGEDGNLYAQPLADLRSHDAPSCSEIRPALRASWCPAYGPGIRGATRRRPSLEPRYESQPERAVQSASPGRGDCPGSSRS